MVMALCLFCYEFSDWFWFLGKGTQFTMWLLQVLLEHIEFERLYL